MKDPLLYFAKGYSRYRQTPPSVIRLLLKPTSLPGVLLVGILGVAILVALQLPIGWPLLYAGIFIGAAARDLGFAMKAAKAWPVLNQLLDWTKIEEIVRGANSKNSV